MGIGRETRSGPHPPVRRRSRPGIPRPPRSSSRACRWPARRTAIRSTACIQAAAARSSPRRWIMPRLAGADFTPWRRGEWRGWRRGVDAGTRRIEAWAARTPKCESAALARWTNCCARRDASDAAWADPLFSISVAKRPARAERRGPEAPRGATHGPARKCGPCAEAPFGRLFRSRQRSFSRNFSE